MATELLRTVSLDQAVVAVVDINGGRHLADSLKNKGFSKVTLAAHPKETFAISRGGSIHVVVVCVAKADANELMLLRALREGSDPPRIVAVAEFSSLPRDMEDKLPEGSRPDLVLVKPVPTARLVHEIELQLVQRSGAWPADDNPPFAEVFADVWQDGRTGMLRVMSEGMQTTIYFREGQPLFAEGGTPADLLGRILVETGRIDEGQLSEAVELMTNSLVDNEQLQLGGALVQLGFVQASELFEVLTEQVRRKLGRCFEWSNVRAEFREGEEHLEGVTEFANPVLGLLMTGCQVTPADEVDRFLRRRAGYFACLAVDARQAEQDFGLGGKHKRLLDAVTGQLAVKELVARAGDSTEVKQVVMALILGRAVTLTTSPTSQPAAPIPPAAKPTSPAPDQRESKPQGQYGSARLVPGDDSEPEKQGVGSKVKSLLHKVKPRDD